MGFVIEKTTLNWFKPVCEDMSEITDWWNRGGQTNFLLDPAHLHLNIIW